MSDDLLEISETQTLKREAAAAKLRALADQLSRHSAVEMSRDGLRFTVKVPDEVQLKVELEIGEDETELEIELHW